MKTLHKYTIVWLILGCLAVVTQAKNLTDLVIGVSLVTTWMVVANVALYRLSKGRGELWMLGAIGLFSVLAICFCGEEFSSNPSVVVCVVVWFGVLMTIYAVIEVKEAKESKFYRLAARIIYGVFLASAILPIVGQRGDIIPKIQKLLLN